MQKEPAGIRHADRRKESLRLMPVPKDKTFHPPKKSFKVTSPDVTFFCAIYRLRRLPLVPYICRVTEYFKIGKFVATHGVKGELVLRHHLGKKTTLKGLTALFLEEKKNAFIPWFPEQTTAKSDTEILVKLDTIDSKEAAQQLAQKEVWLLQEDFQRFSAKTAPLQLLGYVILNGKQELGPILEVVEQPHQLLCRLDMNGREVLIPLNESTLERVDHKHRKVSVTLPEGLLSVYLD